MRSMTGFGRGAVAEDGVAVSVEIKTVNNRFLDVNLRLPSEVNQLDTQIKRVISKRLARGRVDVNVQYDRSENLEYELNRPLIAAYLSAIRQMQLEFELPGEPDLNVVARLPNVLLTKKDDTAPEFIAAVERAVEAALTDLDKMRSSEGEMLKTELTDRLRAIEERIGPIEEQAGLISTEFHERLTKRIDDMLAKSGAQIEIDQGRLAQEVAYLADRADISEEISRLRAHIDHFRMIMSDETEVGKRLDFLTQELNREANTITSKTGNIKVKENALAIKSEIEKIREQVQNVE
ncbi:MAG: YicC family protein [Blastocatellia bacterium]|nr:YicC family protein [Blastocatellia bacterium]